MCATAYFNLYMKKLLNSDWLRAVQLKSNTSAKSIILSAELQINQIFINL